MWKFLKKPSSKGDNDENIKKYVPPFEPRR